jgi:hypothetical protein
MAYGVIVVPERKLAPVAGNLAFSPRGERRSIVRKDLRS